jgi:hypothetical protein
MFLCEQEGILEHFIIIERLCCTVIDSKELVNENTFFCYIVYIKTQDVTGNPLRNSLKKNRNTGYKTNTVITSTVGTLWSLQIYRTILSVSLLIC